jgi:hypothetical protein
MSVTRESRRMSRVTPLYIWRDVRRESRPPVPTRPNPALVVTSGCEFVGQVPNPRNVSRGVRLGLGDDK